MRYTLISDRLSLSVDSKGAELNSIKDKGGYEYLWQGDSGTWSRRAPVLFPIVGKLRNNAYSFSNKTYTLPQHGFARDLEFDLVKQEERELILGLVSNETTRAVFPFDFELRLGYALKNNILQCSYAVKNTGNTALYFSLGAHPGFNVRQSSNKGASFPFLEFEKEELLVSGLHEGLLSDEQQGLRLHNNRLLLNPVLFKDDALVMEGTQIAKLNLCLDAEGRKIQLSCPGWPYFGIWSKPDPKDGTLNYVCLEPWYGVADSVNQRGELQNKKGILKLDAGKTFEAAFELGFF